MDSNDRLVALDANASTEPGVSVDCSQLANLVSMPRSLILLWLRGDLMLLL